jgi:hypothetical protein
VHQDRERLPIAPTGLLDEVSIHLDLRGPDLLGVRFTHYDGRVVAERSAGRETP